MTLYNHLNVILADAGIHVKYPMEIICLTVGGLATNCYLAIDKETRKTLIIDPGDEGDFISTTILEKGLLPQAVILTHGHYDHCLAALELKLNFSLPIYLHHQDLFLYEKAHLSAKHFSQVTIPKLPSIDHFLTDGGQIEFGNSSLKVIHTPGHTPGSICLTTVIASEARQSSSPAIFTGDTLFASGTGSTDHSYSSKTDLQSSLQKIQHICEIYNEKYKIFVYPGHEEYRIMFPL